MKSIFLIAVIALVSSVPSNANAALVCEGDSTMGKLKVTLQEDKVTVEGAALSKPVIFSNVSDQYDGHMSGLITAPGFSMKYENHYGCVRDVVITTNLRDGGHVGYIGTIGVPLCTGGTTPDSICKGLH